MAETDTRLALVVIGVALVLVFGGSTLAYWHHTAGGEVEIEQVEIEGSEGTMEGLLYVPDEASASEPAPGILAVHGYINTKETQSAYAIEYADRGHVVLAIDQPGHGDSDPPALTDDLGGPDALEYLADREEVDTDNIGLEGHSMGGWSVVMAASEHPESYESMVLGGSSTGLEDQGIPAGNETFPRNLGLVFASYDEFSWLMWGSEDSRAIGETERLQTQFGTNETVVPGEQYGSIEEGTARQFYQPSTTHPGMHHSPTAVGQAVEWMQHTLDGNDDTPPDEQRWHWKELGTFLALLGGIALIFPVGGLLVSHDRTSALRREVPAADGASGRGWYLTAGLAFAVPIVTYYPAMLVGSELIEPNWLFPQSETNGIVLWALLNTAIILGLFGVWQSRRDENLSELRANYGLDTGSGARTLGLSAAVAAAVVGTLYVLLWLVHTVFLTDFRIWVVAIRPIATHHVEIFLRYILPLTAFFLALGILLHGQLRTPGRSLRRSMTTNIGLTAGPFVLLLAAQYLPMLTTGSLLVPITALQTIIAIEFVVILTIVAAISTYFFHRTGRIWVGAIVNGLFVTWVIVASQATHVAI